MKNTHKILSNYIFFIIITFYKHIYIYCQRQNCPLYKCSLNGMTDKKCFSRIIDTFNGEENEIIHLKQCSNKEKCSYTSWDSSIGLCITNIRKSFGGEKCKSDADCYSQFCSSSKHCNNINLNEKCTDDKECSKDAVCIFDSQNDETNNDKTCRSLVKLGENCILDETDKSGLHSNCPIFSVCTNFNSVPDAKNGICVEQNSLKIGTNSTNFRACQGNNIILLKNGYYVCSNVSSSAKNCEIVKDQSLECKNNIFVADGQIIDDKEYEIQAQGICRCDIDGNKHCQVVGGPQFDNYINLIRSKLKKNKISENFHVAAFRETFNDYDIAEALFNYKYDGTKADECTKKYFIDNMMAVPEKGGLVNFRIIFLGLLMLFNFL